MERLLPGYRVSVKPLFDLKKYSNIEIVKLITQTEAFVICKNGCLLSFIIMIYQHEK
jgi:hypothetical protein